MWTPQDTLDSILIAAGILFGLSALMMWMVHRNDPMTSQRVAQRRNRIWFLTHYFLPAGCLLAALWIGLHEAGL